MPVAKTWRKAERLGGRVMAVNPTVTSQKCSRCALHSTT
ncbi:MAG: zinc ribbon domain-containing protein [Thermoprotei archaeon]